MTYSGYLNALRPFEHAVVRMGMSKNLVDSRGQAFNPGVNGKVSKEKLEHIQRNWVAWVQTQHAEMSDLAKVCGIKAHGPEAEADSSASEVCS